MGLTVLIVEQNVQQVLQVVDRAYLLEAGTIRASGKSDEMLADDTVRQAYLGVADLGVQKLEGQVQR
jgi:branched-chain amino acid transport system ATP-binding protein